MYNEQSFAPAAPLYRVRQTYGALRGPGQAGQVPMVVVLPWGAPNRDSRAVFHLDRGEQVSPGAVSTVLEMTKAGGTVVFACKSLADATAAFGDLAHAAGYEVTEEVAQ